MTLNKILSGLACFVIAASSACAASTTTTIDAANKYAYGANLGWMDCRGDTNNGAVIGEYVCSGYIYSANVGWINLGSGSPANKIYYQNNSANDFGVNQDGLGNLRGYAWGANIGWINFESTGAPKVDLVTGKFSGSVWSANCGWISLSNAVAYVKTGSISPGSDSDHNGLPDAWEITNFGHIGVDPNADPDDDGMSNLQEYLAGTNPNDPNSSLRITYVARGTTPPNYTTLQWTSIPTRSYVVQYCPNLNSTSLWTDIVFSGMGANSATFSTGLNNPDEFYRIRAFRPLGP